MARTKKETKKEVPAWYNEAENSIILHGEVNKITLSTDKCLAFTVETVTKTPKGNFAHQWLPCVTFDENIDLEVGDLVTVTGYLSNNNYDGKNGKVFSYQVICNEVTVAE